MSDRWFPKCFIEKNHWVVWKLIPDPKNPGKLKKDFYQTHNPSKRAAKNRPGEHSSFKAAKRVCRENGFSGLAYAIQPDDHIVFIDIDHAVDENGVINDMAAGILEQFKGTYIERSQSGTGFHILVKGTIPKNVKRSVEMYNSGYICITGDVFGDRIEPAELQNEINTLYQRITADDPKPAEPKARNSKTLDEEGLTEIYMAAASCPEYGEKFRKVYAGSWAEYYPSQSEADIWVCEVLAYWSDRNETAIDQLIRESGLYRDKYNEPRPGGTWLSTTINKACNSCKESRSEQTEKRKWHTINNKGVVTGVIDAFLVDHILQHERIIIIGGHPRLYINGCYQYDKDGLKIKRVIKDLIFPQVQKINIIDRVYKLLISDPELHRSIEDCNQYPDHLINFQNGMLDPKTGELLPHDPEYYSVNQIPHDYINILDAENSTMAQFIEGIAPDPEDREMLLQYCGYMFTKAVHLKKFLSLEGVGDVGKSTFLRVLQRSLGLENYAALKLQQLNERFYPTQLLGKLADICADIPSTEMKQVDNIKLITGDDPLTGEYKGFNSFTFKSYAKLIFSANKMPKCYEDTTGAYFNRLLILRIDKPGTRIPDLEEKLRRETDVFISLCIDALTRMYKTGFIESQNSRQHVELLRRSSDTVAAFLGECTEKINTGKVKRDDLFSYYETFCFNYERSPRTRQKFYECLRDEGFNTNIKIHGDLYVKGLKIHPDVLK